VLRHLTLVAALALAWPAAAHAQSLAELAKKTEKKKKDDKGTITSEDLRRAGASRHGNVSPPASATAGKAEAGAGAETKAGGDAEAGEEKTPDELREEARADWSKRLTDAEAEVARLEGQVAELEQSLANPGMGTVEERQRRVEQLATAQADLATARQSVTALGREGRQNGYRR